MKIHDRNILTLCKRLEQESDYSNDPLPVSFCTGIPCIGTPELIADLIKAGYGNVLRLVTVHAIACTRSGAISSSKDIQMVQLVHDKNGCAMYKDGECLLWKSGLTPLMGKLHLIMGNKLQPKLLKLLLYVTITQWVDSSNASTVDFCLKKLKKNVQENNTN